MYSLIILVTLGARNILRTLVSKTSLDYGDNSLMSYYNSYLYLY